MPRQITYTPMHRFSLVLPADLYDQLMEAVPDDLSITAWIVEAIIAKLHQAPPK